MGSSEGGVITTSPRKSSTDIPSTSSMEAAPATPDRQTFEQHLWRLNHGISNITRDLRNYWNEKRRTEFSELTQDNTRLRKGYHEYGVDEKAMNEDLQKLQEQHTKKQREIHEIENDLTYKDLRIAQEKLNRAESHYKRKNFSNMREEQAAVNEIDKLRRNIVKLAKYLPLIDERKRLDESIKAARMSLREVRSKMRSNRDKINENRLKINKLQQPYRKLKAHLNDLRADRRALIDEYEHERKNFAIWMKEKKYDKAISTFPTAMLHEDFCDELEPFHEKKRTCNRLIQYLNRLTSACDEDHGIVEEPPTGGDTSDSADELPKAFYEKLVIKMPQGNPKAKKKKTNVKKGVKKQNMPITHSIDYIKLFGDLDLLPPKTYGEAEGVLEEVKKILAFYEEQTSLVENNDELSISPIPSMISMSGSECFDSPMMSPRSTSSCRDDSQSVSYDGSHGSGSRYSDISFRNEAFRLAYMNSARNSI